MNYREFDAFSAPLDAINLVEAAAGTGKTYNIQTLTIRALLEKSLPVESLLLLTFTNAAAAELKSRIFSIIQTTLTAAESDLEQLTDAQKDDFEREIKLIQNAGNAGLSRADIIFKLHQAQINFDRAQISTIHSFCSNILRDFAFECHSDADFEVMQNDADIVHEFIEDFLRNLFFRDGKAWCESSFFQWEQKYFITILKKYLSTPDIELITAAGEVENDFDFYRTKIKQLFENLAQMPCDFSKFSNLENYNNDLKKIDPFEKLPAIIRQGSIKRQDWTVINNLTPSALKSYLNKGKKKTYPLVSANIDECREIALIGEISDLARLAQGALLIRAKNEIAERMRQRNQQTHTLSNDDLISHSVEAIEKYPDLVSALKNKFKFGIIDEFQDTDPSQCIILDKLFFNSDDDRALFLIGDPRQAIYGFRGCDLNSYLAVARSIAPERRYTLSCNFRSNGALLDQFNMLFGKHSCAFAKEEFRLPILQVGPKPGRRKNPLSQADGSSFPPFAIVKADVAMAENVVACVSGLMQKNLFICDETEKSPRPLKLADIMILTRVWRNASTIKAALNQAGFPANTIKCKSLFASEDAGELLIFLQALCHCNNADLVAQSLATSICGFAVDKIFDANDEIKAEYTASLEELFAVWKNDGFPALFQKIIDLFDIYKRYPKMPNGAKKLASFTTLGNLLRNEYLRRHLSPEALIHFLADGIENRENNYEAYPEPMGENDSSIRIMTMHGSKGLQFPVVICADLDIQPQLFKRGNVCFFYSETKKKRVLAVDPGDEEIATRNNQIFEECLRLGYVAMTRAVNCCIVCCDSRKKSGSVMDFFAGCRNFSAAIGSAVDEAKAVESWALPKELFLPLPEKIKYHQSKNSTQEISACKFSGQARQNWKIKSFSALTTTPGDSAKSSEIWLDSAENDEASSPGIILSMPENPFPRLSGKRFGDFLHKIIAEGDFNIDFDRLKDKLASRMPYPEVTGEETGFCAKLLCNAVNADLPKIGKLREIPTADRLAEMRFNLAMKKPLDSAKLFNLAGLPAPEMIENIPGGMLTGSIDLFFRKNDRYYILDWKSNLLNDYSPKSLLEEMTNSRYRLQLLIYTVAAVKFLQLRMDRILSEADYNIVFGGAYYLFLRGIDPQLPDNGIFFERPAYHIVQEALELFE